MIARTEQEKKNLREAGKMLALILRMCAGQIKSGTSAAQLDILAEKEIRKRAAVPIFLRYENEDSPYPYPATICISINDEVVHGIPTDTKIVRAGDVVSLDLGLSYKGCVVDAAVTVIAGAGDKDTRRLVEGTRQALQAGIAAARAGNFVGDIGAATLAVAKEYRLSVVRDLGGHGTGKDLHETPFIPNYGSAGRGEALKEGMVLALEPIFALGEGAIELAQDGWTYKTRSHSRTAHFEHTILVGKEAAEILTQ